MVIDCQLQISYNDSIMVGHTRRQGFTIVEILVVIAVISILTAVGTYGFNKIQERAYDAKVDATLDQIEKGIKLYITKGNRIQLMHHSSGDFYAPPGGTRVIEGLPVFRGGGLGNTLNQAGVLSGDLQQPLKDRGPKRDIGLKNNIWMLQCGRSKLFIIIESYSGIRQKDLNDMLYPLHCNYNSELDWRRENGLLEPGNWGSIGGNYRVQPYYKFVEIKL